jgi:hypothetical protein
MSYVVITAGHLRQEQLRAVGAAQLLAHFTVSGETTDQNRVNTASRTLTSTWNKDACDGTNTIAHMYDASTES